MSHVATDEHYDALWDPVEKLEGCASDSLELGYHCNRLAEGSECTPFRGKFTTSNVILLTSPGVS